jgi:hypothetical protein
LSPSDLKSEVAKARKLASRGLARNYLLFTNFGVSGQTDADLKKEFESIPGVEAFLSFGRDWIVQQILASTRLRMLVPRIYGLGDLSQILDDRQYRQAAEILASMQRELAKFVITDAHRKSANAILDHSFVFLLGEPASGKSTIAASLALGAIDNWKCSTLKVRSAQEFARHWNPNESAQFFWVDDVFGPNQYQGTWVQDWNSVLPHLNAAVQKGTKVLFTSRDYIYRAALRDLKVSAFPLLTESQVVIRVQQLTLPEKNQILYNHLKLGNQPTAFKTRIKTFLPNVSHNAKFLPEIARRLGDPLFTKKLAMSLTSVTYFVEHPLEWLKEVITTLDAESKAALALIFMGGGALDSPLSLAEPFVDNALQLLGGSVAGVRQALSDMNDSLVKNVRSADSAKWVYKHPTIGDALTEIIAADPELVEIYVRGTPIERITMEAVCGAASVEGAKVVIPRSHYDRLVDALSGLQKEPRLTFLSQRCGEDFLKRYIERTPNIWNDLAAFEKLFGSPEISLAARLQELHLLPGHIKGTITNRVIDLSADWPDSDFLDPEKFRHLFSDSEIEAMFGQVISRLMPEIDRLIDDWDSNFYSSGEEPDSFYGPLLDCLQNLYTWTKDPQTEELLRAAISSAEASLEDAQSNYVPAPEPDYHDHYGYQTPSVEVERDMFDDIDE